MVPNGLSLAPLVMHFTPLVLSPYNTILFQMKYGVESYLPETNRQLLTAFFEEDSLEVK